jgi:four helix bundle protein
MTERLRIQTHRDLKVWQLGMEIAERMYQITKAFPDDERFGLISQLRRAAVSIPANIAEGNARNSTKEYLRHLSIAVGSLAEIETLLDLSQRLRFGQPTSIDLLVELVGEERRMLRGLQRSIRAKLDTNCSDLRPLTSDL